MQVINWILRFVGLAFIIAFQVLVLNNLDTGIYIHPYIYPMFIFMLPLNVPKWIMLPLAFLVGLIIDMFNMTPGMHASACVLMAFLRAPILKLLTPPTGYDAVGSPNIRYLGATWFTIFTAIMVFIHHTFYFFVEILSFQHLGYTLLKIVLSGIISTFLILILTFLFTTKKERK
ncbi:MAG: rod shape-determining protein MreD [Fimbriimonadaceae bacterium]|nr:rod shape-determining protein MreD [Chitinophagales bacterium]